MKKLRLLSIVLIAALLVAGTSYAVLSGWTESLAVNGTVHTGEADWAFDTIQTKLDDEKTGANESKDWTCDENFENEQQIDQNVGSTTFSLVDTDGDLDNDTAVVTVNNAYPGYYNYVSFKVKNNGTIPLKVQEMVADNPEPLAVKLGWSDDSGSLLMPAASRSITVWFLVRENAQQNQTYTFTISAPAIQWNKY